jgi:hypothetical protein
MIGTGWRITSTTRTTTKCWFVHDATLSPFDCIVLSSSTASLQDGPHAARAVMTISRATRSGAFGLQLPHNFCLTNLVYTRMPPAHHRKGARNRTDLIIGRFTVFMSSRLERKQTHCCPPPANGSDSAEQDCNAFTLFKCNVAAHPKKPVRFACARERRMRYRTRAFHRR